MGIGLQLSKRLFCVLAVWLACVLPLFSTLVGGDMTLLRFAKLAYHTGLVETDKLEEIKEQPWSILNQPFTLSDARFAASLATFTETERNVLLLSMTLLVVGLLFSFLLLRFGALLQLCGLACLVTVLWPISTLTMGQGFYALLCTSLLCLLVGSVSDPAASLPSSSTSPSPPLKEE
ncbi:hypothetical protein QOT17_014048 [Balamuthia mandrillaris]